MNNKKESSSYPPEVLIKTWVHNLMQSKDREVKNHAKNMLIGAFGDMQAVAVHIKKNNIKV